MMLPGPTGRASIQADAPGEISVPSASALLAPIHPVGSKRREGLPVPLRGDLAGKTLQAGLTPGNPSGSKVGPRPTQRDDGVDVEAALEAAQLRAQIPNRFGGNSGMRTFRRRSGRGNHAPDACCMAPLVEAPEAPAPALLRDEKHLRTARVESWPCLAMAGYA